MSRNIFLEIAYDGSEFNGWQLQENGRSVQGELETALARLHDRRRVVVYGAGRTDSGVHARGQCANFETDHRSIPPKKFREAINSHLPPDVRVRRSVEVPAAFHARHSATEREYRYYLLPGEIVLPHQRRYCVRLKRNADLRGWNRMAAALCGEHDFTSFASPSESADHHVRRVYSAAFYPEREYIVFRISANAFLWKMVRSIVGTIIGMGTGDVDSFVEILHARDRSRAGTTAPARGLFLHHIRYGESIHGERSV
ncbi:MAG: tRNA pseudouridine(38-40) synthase TruA [Spirochaetota bacterium]